MVIEVKNLIKRYKEVTALDHFNLEMKKGEILGLLGPNGSGKTTAINCILSILKYQKGDIKVFGEEITPNKVDIKKRIGIVPQELALFDDLTVYENIDYFCGLYIKNRLERRKLVEEAIEFVDISSHRKFQAKKLSGGLKRRLNIACGIAHKPELIFLDEPTVAVDAQTRNFILEGIIRLSKNGTSICYTSHYLEEVERICSKIVIIDKGKNIAEGTKDELLSLLESNENVTLNTIHDYENIMEDIKSLEEVISIEEKDKLLYEIKINKGHNNLSNLIDFISKKGYEYNHIYSQRPSLDDVFLELTGKELRE